MQIQVFLKIHLNQQRIGLLKVVLNKRKNTCNERVTIKCDLTLSMLSLNYLFPYAI